MADRNPNKYIFGLLGFAGLLSFPYQKQFQKTNVLLFGQPSEKNMGLWEYNVDSSLQHVPLLLAVDHTFE